MLNSLFCEFDNIGIPYLQDQKMADYTTFKIGGTADAVVFPKNTEQLKALLKILRENDVPYFVIGNGSNLLVSDNGYAGVVISLKNFNEIKLTSALTVTCSAGVMLSKLCSFAMENSLGGLEFAWGIPGTVGGAIYMNAGAYNGEIADVVTECIYMDESGTLLSADVSALDFGYRKSVFTTNRSIILSATFKLSFSQKEVIKSQMDNLIKRRKDKQPLEFPSAGSTFKRPQGYFAAALIDECGLKGTSVGGAAVSEKHAGFIVNTGNATCSDVIALMEKVKHEVFMQKSVMLEPEVKIIGQ